MNKKAIYFSAIIIAIIGFLVINLTTEPKREITPIRAADDLTPVTPAPQINNASAPTAINPDMTAEAAIDSHTPVKDTDASQQLPPITTPSYLPVIAKKPITANQFQGDLTDHQAYLNFHEQQQTQLEQRFIIAAQQKITNLESLLEKGRQEGLPQQQLQVAIDKIAALKDMQAKLKNKSTNLATHH
ncbi:hypothetical protein [Pseudoalteromonas arctica]|uniref:Uncharacterized protein n=1 Tax=Pseudoalteromonas arctica TaxID=394751 RepID=A0A7Y0DTD0_9GAMM|nr:hypothetical protein [Pseudoalteromonas arctica]NMM41219.1 hypothetical protein [Pseudoalteromonas arctica]